MHSDAVPPLQAYPVSPRCAEALDRGVHALIGISPFNSYFSEARITALLRCVRPRFAVTQIFVPDEPACFTLEAIGYEPTRARRKARRQANYLKNKIHRAFHAVGIPDDHRQELIVCWQTLEANPRYRRAHAALQERFREEAPFRCACMEASAWVLQDRALRKPLAAGALERAAEYFLAELPLLLSSPAVLQQPSSVFCYHRLPPFLDNLYRGNYGIRVDPGQGFAVVRERDTRAA